MTIVLPSLPLIVAGYVFIACLVALFAGQRGRALILWLMISLTITPLVALVILWLLPDLTYENQRLLSTLVEVKQRRHRRDPDDAFTRAREQHDHEIQEKVTTARIKKKQATIEPIKPKRGLRSQGYRTPKTPLSPA